MKLWGLFVATLVASAVVCLPAFAASRHLLFLADSHALGPFGDAFERALVNDGFVETETFALGGSAPSWFFHGTVSACGYAGRADRLVPPPKPRRCARMRTPLLSGLLRKGETVVVALGTNLINDPLGWDYARGSMRKMAQAIRAAGADCVWIGPPRMRRFAEARLDAFYGVVGKALVGERSGMTGDKPAPLCPLIDSRELTAYPEKGGDGIHYSFPAGIPIARAWGAGAARETRRLLGEAATSGESATATVNATACDPLHPPGPGDLPNPNAGLLESRRAEPVEAGCPAGMARIEPAGGAPYCIDRFGAFLTERREDGTESYWSPYHNPGKRNVRAVALEGAVPQGYISGGQAEAACVNAGKRLCTDQEFLRACQGPKGMTYPYAETRYPTGTSPEDPACNESRGRHPALELFPNSPHPFSHLDNACINQLERTVARAGSFAKCVSAERVYDLMGNLHEWVAGADPVTGRGRFRGGYYMDTRRNGEGCRYVTRAHRFETYWDYSTGFRCCADAR